jgi:hypothetical protein
MMIVYDQQITPIDFWGQWIKGQGHIGLVGKNSFRVITKESLGLGTSNLV